MELTRLVTVLGFVEKVTAGGRGKGYMGNATDGYATGLGGVAAGVGATG